MVLHLLHLMDTKYGLLLSAITPFLELFDGEVTFLVVSANFLLHFGHLTSYIKTSIKKGPTPGFMPEIGP
jgi:hypothetical protein